MLGEKERERQDRLSERERERCNREQPHPPNHALHYRTPTYPYTLSLFLTRTPSLPLTHLDIFRGQRV